MAVTAGQWFAQSVRNLGGSVLNRWLLALVVLTGVWQLWSIARRILDPDLEWYAPVLIGSALVVMVAGALAWAMWRSSPALRADPRNVWPVGMPSTLAEAWNPLLLLFGFVLALPLFPVDIVIRVTAIIRAMNGPAALVRAGDAAASALGSAWFRSGVRMAAAVVFGVWAWRRTRRGQAHLGLLASAMIAVWGLSMINRVSGERLLLTWSTEAITTYTSLAAWGWFVLA